MSNDRGNRLTARISSTCFSVIFCFKRWFVFGRSSNSWLHFEPTQFIAIKRIQQTQLWCRRRGRYFTEQELHGHEEELLFFLCYRETHLSLFLVCVCFCFCANMASSVFTLHPLHKHMENNNDDSRIAGISIRYKWYVWTMTLQYKTACSLETCAILFTRKDSLKPNRWRVASCYESVK
jgi:hypothetical protein